MQPCSRFQGEVAIIKGDGAQTHPVALSSNHFSGLNQNVSDATWDWSGTVVPVSTVPPGVPVMPAECYGSKIDTVVDHDSGVSGSGKVRQKQGKNE